MILSPDLITRRITYPFVPAAFCWASVGFKTFTTSSVIVAPFASASMVLIVSWSSVTLPFSVFTVKSALVFSLMFFTNEVSSCSCTFSAPFVSEAATSSTISADLFSAACLRISLWFSALMVAVAVLPLTLTSVGAVVVAEPAAPEVVTSLTSSAPGTPHLSEPSSLV